MGMETKITAVDGYPGMTPDMLVKTKERVYIDPFEDDGDITECGIENPEYCESCT